jgi:hypothetical protein
MRLIKLSTIDDKGQFNTNFTTDIDLKPGASIALKSCSFEPEIKGFNSNAFTGQFEMRYDSRLTNSFGSPIVDITNYNIGDERKLLFRLNNALNRGLGLTSARNNGQSSSTILSQYLVYLRDEKVHIEMRLSPLIYPFTSDISRTGAFMITPPAPYNTIFNTTGGVVSVGNGNAARTDETYRLTTPHGVGLSKGGGVFMAQIKKSVVTGTPNANGFKLGIAMHRVQLEDSLGVSTDPRSDEGLNNIPHAARNFEIDMRDSNNNYRFINLGFGENIAGDEFVDSGIAPHKVADGDDANDIIMFEIDTELNDQKVVRGSVIKQNGGSFTKQVLFTFILDEIEQNSYSRETETGKEIQAEEEGTLGIDFVPYIVFRGNEDSIELTNVRFSLNPFILPTDFDTPGTEDEELENPALPLTASATPSVDASLAGSLPPVGEIDLSAVIDTITESRLTLGAELSGVLGYLRRSIERDIRFEFSDGKIIDNGGGEEFATIRTLLPAFDVMAFLKEQLYMIEIQSFDILSYESSALNPGNRNNPTLGTNFNTKNFNGDRKNILDVILTNDLDDGLIIHEPNNINFIDIGNTTTFNLRNLRLRIVDDNFYPVDTTGVSHIILLIKD